MFFATSFFFFLVFAFAMMIIVAGIWRTSRLSGKIFRAFEQELDRKLNEERADPVAAKQKCAHCGAMVAAAEKCPNCGADLV